ncbi:MAG: efflux RND transporter periplasmic adaptor subunit [Gemmatimonadota bacterium]
MKSRYVVTVIVFVVALAALGGVLWRLQQKEPAAAGAPGDGGAVVDSARAEARSTAAASAFATGVAVPVEGSAVRRGAFVLWANAEGQAAALRRAPLLAEVAGPVTDVPVREGDFVAAAGLVARIDPRLYELELKEAEGALEQAQATYLELTLGDDRIEDASVREERRRQARVRSGLAGAEARVEKARYNLAKTEIRAPYAGRVADLGVDVGSRAGQGDAIATVVDVSSIDVEVRVLESAIAAIERGRDASVRFSAIPGETFAGKVVSVNPVVDPASHVGRATVRLANPRARVLPGMHATVRIAGTLFEDRVSVPKEAIVERSRREVVFVFEPESEGSDVGLAKWRYVTTGLENEEAVEIVPSDQTDMVREGEIVLTGGHTTLTHDARVRLVTGAPGAPGEAP